MHPPRALALLALAAAAGMAGCWSLTTDVPDLTGGSIGSPGDAAPTDGGNASPESGGDADGTFCASLGRTPTLCDDFDQGTLGSGWSEPRRVENGGTLAFDSSNVRSRPNALLVRGAADKQDSPTAQLNHRVSTVPRQLALAFDLDVESASSAAGHILAGLVLHAAADYRIDLTLLGDRLRVLETGGAIHPSNAPTPMNQWVHVALTVDFGATPTFSLEIDGTHVADGTIAASATSGAGGVTLELGHYEGPPYPTSGVATFRFDNVVWDVTAN